MGKLKRLLIAVSVLAVMGSVAWAQDPDFEAGSVVLKRGQVGSLPAAPTAMAPAEQATKRAPVESRTGLTVISSGIATRLAFGQPADQVEKIPASQGNWYPWLKLRGAADGERLECRLLFRAPSGVVEAARASTRLAGGESVGLCDIKRPADMAQWPAGQYELRYLVGGRSVHRLMIEVTP